MQEKNENFLSGIKKSFMHSEGFTVGTWDIITKILSYISLLEIILYIKKRNFNKIINTNCEIKCGKNCEVSLNNSEHCELRKNFNNHLYNFIEGWVTFQLVFVILVYGIVFNFLNSSDIVPIYIFSIYGSLRIFEIIIKQTRVILFDTIGTKAIKLKSPRRSIILLFYNVAEMVLWFAVSLMGLFLLNSDVIGFSFIHLSDIFEWDDFIKCSTLQFTTFGDSYSVISDVIEKHTVLSNITFWEIIVGFIIIVISMARLFSLLPPVENQAFGEKK